MKLDEYRSCDATELARRVRSGELAPEEPAAAARAAVTALNPMLNAIVDMQPDLPPPHWNGSFAGVPLPLKDCVGYLDGQIYSFGSRLAAGTRASGTSSVVQRLREAGFHLLGLTNVPEFSSLVTTESRRHGPAHNPHRRGFSTGGSSGGAAAAVAAGLFPAAYANDGAGSIRVPAACCGIVGLKTSRGRIPTGPHKNEFWHGLMAHGVVTRSVRDTAAIVDCCAVLDSGAPYTAPPLSRPLAQEVGAPCRGLRIAWTTASPYGEAVHAECAAAVTALLPKLAALGCELVERAPRYDGRALLADVATLVSVSLAADLPDFSKAHGRPVDADHVERNNLAWAQRGSAVRAADFQKLLYRFGAVGRAVGRFFDEGVDLLLTPTTALPPPAHGWLDADGDDLDAFIDRWWRFSPFASLANVSGTPAISVPAGRSSAGLPLGAMFMAAYGNEAALIRVASALEQER